MINREIKRLALARNCPHEWTESPVKDPVDKRRTLKPHGMAKAYCRKCGVAKLT